MWSLEAELLCVFPLPGLELVVEFVGFVDDIHRELFIEALVFESVGVFGFACIPERNTPQVTD